MTPADLNHIVFWALAVTALIWVGYKLCWLLTQFSRYGVIGCLYLLSAWLHAFGDAERARRVIAAEYRTRALRMAPKRTIDVPVRRRRRPSLLRRARKMLLALAPALRTGVQSEPAVITPPVAAGILRKRAEVR